MRPGSQINPGRIATLFSALRGRFFSHKCTRVHFNGENMATREHHSALTRYRFACARVSPWLCFVTAMREARRYASVHRTLYSSSFSL